MKNIEDQAKELFKKKSEELTVLPTDKRGNVILDMNDSKQKEWLED